MAKLLSSKQMQEVDRRTIEELGLPGMVLMENAGSGVVRVLQDRLPDWRKRRVLVLAGAGNNGGDGFVVARQLMMEGISTSVVLFGQGDKLKGDARTNHQVYHRLGGTIREVADTDDPAFFQTILAHTGIVVDAIFGTGLQRPITGLIATIISMANQSGKPILAVDIPSGVSADTGQILGVAIQADWTVTFAAEKIGHRVFPGAQACGKIHLVSIGIPSPFIDIPAHAVAQNLMLDLDFPPRPPDGHKGHFGHLVVVAGSVGKEGAAALAALGAQRVGPGLVTVATPKAALPSVSGKILEAMTLPLPDDGSTGCLGEESLETFLRSRIQPAALAIGPGLGTGSWILPTIKGLLQACRDIPVVLDADALNALAQDGFAGLPDRQAPLVLTPHPGELARLLRTTVAEIQRDRLHIAIKTAQDWHVWLVLKGAGTIIASPNGQAWVNATGNSGLAAGGSGDVLTGIIAGLLAQGWPTESCVRAGVWLHGAAADAAAVELGGEAGLLARDLLKHLQHLRNRLR